MHMALIFVVCSLNSLEHSSQFSLGTFTSLHGFQSIQGKSHVFIVVVRLNFCPLFLFSFFFKVWAIHRHLKIQLLSHQILVMTTFSWHLLINYRRTAEYSARKLVIIKFLSTLYTVKPLLSGHLRDLPKCQLNCSLYIDVVLFFWKTSACARKKIFFFPRPYPFAMTVNKSPAIYFFITRICEKPSLIEGVRLIRSAFNGYSVLW